MSRRPNIPLLFNDHQDHYPHRAETVSDLGQALQRHQAAALDPVDL